MEGQLDPSPLYPGCLNNIKPVRPQFIPSAPQVCSRKLLMPSKHQPCSLCKELYQVLSDLRPLFCPNSILTIKVHNIAKEKACKSLHYTRCSTCGVDSYWPVQAMTDLIKFEEA